MTDNKQAREVAIQKAWLKYLRERSRQDMRIPSRDSFVAGYEAALQHLDDETGLKD